MDAISLLRNRLAASSGMIQDVGQSLVGLDLVSPVVPGTSPLGLTLWHLPRTQDWAVQAVIRGVPEVADKGGRAGLPDPESWGFGIDLTPHQATEVAGMIEVDAVLEYAQAVHTEIDAWLSDLSESDLDVIPEWSAHMQRRALYASDGYAREAGDLPGKPIGVLLLRPALSHVVHHLGELDVLAQIARA